MLATTATCVARCAARLPLTAPPLAQLWRRALARTAAHGGAAAPAPPDAPALSALHARMLASLARHAAPDAPVPHCAPPAPWRSPVAPRRWQSQLGAPVTAGDAGEGAHAGSGAAPPSPPPPHLALDDLLITPGAVRKLSALRERAVAEGKAGAAKTQLRIRVDGGGCSGFKYSFQLEAADPEPDDVVFDRRTARVVVDAVSLGLIRGSTVDFHEEMMRASFAIVNNPNSESSCGCGSSFAAKA